MSETNDADPVTVPARVPAIVPAPVPAPPGRPPGGPREGPEEGPRPRKVDPLHGVTLEALLTTLVEEVGFDELGERLRMNCFVSNPSITSSLKFLRKTPWAREKVEAFYISTRKTS